VLSDTVRVGDLVLAWNDSFFYSDDKTAYHYPGVPYWAGAVWDWGDGTSPTVGGPIVNHVYSKPGTYTVTMKFTDTENAVGAATAMITVSAMP
jgi:chitodextrinase